MKKSRFNVKYPRNEKAYSYLNESGVPFTSAVIGVTYPNPDYEIISESRDYCVLEFVLEGEGEVLLGEQWQTVQKGDTYILLQGEKHAYRANPQNPFKKIWINYSAHYFSALAAAYGVKSGVYKADVLQYFQKLYELFKQERKENIEYVIADYAYQILKTVATANHREKNVFAQKIKNALNGCVYKKTNMEEISQKLFSSKSNIIRVFKAEYGVTPYEYLLDMKIASAKLMLSNSQMTIKEIADRLCILDEHYFSTLFLKRTGMRPKDYRQTYFRK